MGAEQAQGLGGPFTEVDKVDGERQRFRPFEARPCGHLAIAVNGVPERGIRDDRFPPRFADAEYGYESTVGC